MRKLTVGCDPELFMFDQYSATYIPSCGLIGGSKHQAIPIGDGIMVHEDNVTVEFGMMPVQHEFGSREFYDEAQSALSLVTKYAQDKVGAHIALISTPTITFKDHQMKHPKCFEFGCDPDLNAHLEGARNPPQNTEAFGLSRDAGGHIHLGYPVNEVEIPDHALIQLIEALALYPMLQLSRNYVGKERCTRYGQPGAFRRKPYGVEYRTPSNYWLTGGPTLPLRIANVALWAINNDVQSRELYDMIPHAQVRALMSKTTVDVMLSRRMGELYLKYIGSWGGARNECEDLIDRHVGVGVEVPQEF